MWSMPFLSSTVPKKPRRLFSSKEQTLLCLISIMARTHTSQGKFHGGRTSIFRTVWTVEAFEMSPWDAGPFSSISADVPQLQHWARRNLHRLSPQPKKDRFYHCKFALFHFSLSNLIGAWGPNRSNCLNGSNPTRSNPLLSTLFSLLTWFPTLGGGKSVYNSRRWRPFCNWGYPRNWNKAAGHRYVMETGSLMEI